MKKRTNINKIILLTLSIGIIFGAFSASYAEDKYVNGEVTASYTDIASEERYTKSCSVKYQDDFFTRDNSQFDIELARMSVVAVESTMSAFYYTGNTEKVSDSDKDINIKTLLTEELKFTNYKSFRYDKDVKDTGDTCAYSIAEKDVNIDGKDTKIIAVGIRSGFYSGEWYSNAICYGEDYPSQHNGFSRAAKDVYLSLEEYVEENGIDASKAKVWIYGYSRGAGIANILSADLIKNNFVDKNNIYCYCIGTPKTTKEPVSYDGIFNVINPTDIVPKLPLAYWGYSWYGKVIALPYKTNDLEYSQDIENVKSIFKDITNGLTYTTYTNHFIAMEALCNAFNAATLGSEEVYGIMLQEELAKASGKYIGKTDDSVDFIKLLGNMCITHGISSIVTGVVAAEVLAEFSITDIAELENSTLFRQHWTETYYSFLMNGKTYEGLKTRLLSISSAVDVRVYDENHKLVSEIKGDSYKNFTKKNALETYVDENGVKKIYLPKSENYTVEIEAKEDGLVNCSVDEIGDEGITEEKVNYLDISVNEGDMLTCDIKAGEISLVKNGSETIKHTDVLSDDEIGDITVNAKVKGNGIVTGITRYTKGDSAELRAEAMEGAEFKGWYKNGKLVSSDSIYGIECIQKDIEITAVFTNVIEDDDVTLKYTGKGKRPSVTVKDGDKVLKENKSYTLVYDKNIEKIGKHKVTIKGKGDYSGSVTKYFTVNPEKTQISTLRALRNGFVVKWNKQGKEISGYQIEYSSSKSFKDSKSVSVKGNSRKIKNVKEKKYYVRVRAYTKVDDEKYYSSWSNVKEVKLK